MGLLLGYAAVVTGAGASLGRTHALAIAAAGARVIVNDIGIDGARSVAAKIEAAGGLRVAFWRRIGDRIESISKQR